MSEQPRRARGSRDEDLFRDLCDNALDMIQSVGPDGDFLYVNRAWRETLGYSRADVESLRWPDVVHPDSRERCGELMRGLLQGGDPVRMETDFVSREGRRVPVEGTASCRFEEGRPLWTRGVFRDLRLRRQSERELHRLFQLASDLLCVANVEGFFTRVNPAFERILGYSEEELRSRSFLEFIHPDDRARTLAELADIDGGAGSHDFENRYRAKDGSYRWLAWRSSPAQEQGLIYAIARDITEQREAQQQLVEKAEELRHSNAELDRFAHVVSHDLQAPLRAAANLTAWISDELPDDDGELRDHADELRQRIRRMEALTGELLEYHRSGRETAPLEQVDVGELLDAVMGTVGAPGFELVVDSELPSLRARRPALEQVLRNIVGNAVEHHDRGEGRIRVAARRMGEMWEFRISDDGPGVGESVRRGVEELQETGRSAPGVGIGLHLVARRVRVATGRLWIEGGDERGATVCFTWPQGPPED